MEEKSLLYNVQGGVGLITINRPDQGNAITGEVTSLFDQALDQAEKNEAVKVVRLTGAGEKAFCTGGQLSSRFGKADEGDPAG